MTKGEKEMATLVGEYTEKLLKMASKTNTAVGTLKTIKDGYNKKWWQILLKFLPCILPFAILIAIVIALYALGCHTTIKYQEIEITRNCTR